ncbi:unnamed protein product, partial [Adineta steineri]
TIKSECRCKGKLEPKIVWKKDKIEIKDKLNKYKISKTKGTDDTYTFILEILNATSTDNGVYKILAKNDAGDSQALINLNIDTEAAPPKDEEAKKKAQDNAIPTISTPIDNNFDENDRRLPKIQTEESLYEEAGPRRAKTTDRPKRPSASNLNVISENPPSLQIRTDQPEE